jgi:protein SCO1
LLALNCVKAGAAVLLAAIVALATPARSAQTPQLIDQNGHAFTLGSLVGKPLIVTFIAAHCTDACPLINAQFQQADQLFVQRHLDVRLLTVTLDPEHDPPAVMRDLARRFNADPRRWVVAGGSNKNVHAVMRMFGVQAERGRKGYADVHTTFVYMFDKHGKLRKTILASTILGAQLADEIHAHWRELVQ